MPIEMSNGRGIEKSCNLLKVRRSHEYDTSVHSVNQLVDEVDPVTPIRNNRHYKFTLYKTKTQTYTISLLTTHPVYTPKNILMSCFNR